MDSKEFETAYKQSVHIKPAVGGMLQKSHPFSFFLKVNANSSKGKILFSENPRINTSEVTILQVAYLDNTNFFCEVVNKQDMVSCVPNKKQIKIGF